MNTISTTSGAICQQKTIGNRKPLARRSQSSIVNRLSIVNCTLLIVFCLFFAGKAWGQNTDKTWNFNSNSSGTMVCGSSFTISGNVNEKNRKDFYYVLTSSSSCPITISCTNLTGAGSSSPHLYVYEGSGTSGTELANWNTSGGSVTSSAGVITIRITRNQTQNKRQVSYSLTVNQSCTCCPEPTSLNVTDITGSSATVSWNGTAGSYNMRYAKTEELTEVFSDDFESGLGSWTTKRSGNDSY